MLTLLSKQIRILSSLNKTYIVLISYLLIHILLRLVFTDTLQIDDAEQVRLGQNIQLGYNIPQPPLYSWIAWLGFKLFGINIYVLTVIKYLFIGITFFLVSLISERISSKKEIQNIIIFSYLLMPSFAWHMHQGFTHTILLGMSILMTIHALFKIIDNQNTISYIYLGIALGLGLMSKYSYLIFLIIFILTCVSISDFRKSLLNSKTILTLLTVIVISGPHLYWIFENYEQVFHQVNQKISPSLTKDFASILGPFINFLSGFIGFISPLILVYLIFFKHLKINIDTTFKKFFLHFYLIALSLIVLAFLIFSIPEFKVRWFHPLLMISPFFLGLFLDNKKDFYINFKKIFYFLLLLVTILVISVRVFQFTLSADYGLNGRLNTPITITLNKLKSKISLENKILVTKDNFLGSHLLISFPDKFIIVSNQKYNESNDVNGCILIEDNDSNNYKISKLNSTKEMSFAESKIGDSVYRISAEVKPKNECIELIR